VITPAALTVTATDDTKVYDGLAYTGGNGVVYIGFVNNETEAVLGGTLAYSGSSQGAINVGKYVITPGGLTSGNYDITFEDGELDITPAALTVTATDDTKVYDGLAYTGGNGVVYIGFVNNETEAVLGGTLAYSGSSQGAINVGKYVITPGGLTSGNYDITFENGELDITPAALTVTATDDTKVYDGLAYTGGNGVVYIGFVNNETEEVLGGTLAYSGSSQGAINVGKYVITPGGLTSGNYDITFENGELDITPAALTVTATDDTKVYDGLAYTGGNGVVYIGFVNNETEEVLGGTLAYSGSSQGAINVGKYVITPGGLTSGNYDITFENGELDITPAALTVTATDDTKVYDGLAYTGGNGVVYIGFVNNETEEVLGGTLAYSGSSQGAINVGKYVITPGGLTSGNYDITFENGELDITPAALTITATNQTKVYGSVFTFEGNEFTSAGLVNGDAITNVSFTSTGAVATATVGAHLIQLFQVQPRELVLEIIR
jgi:trimeric autotransporter adhesin